MNRISKIALITALVSAVSSPVFAQGAGGGPKGESTPSLSQTDASSSAASSAAANGGSAVKATKHRRHRMRHHHKSAASAPMATSSVMSEKPGG